MAGTDKVDGSGPKGRVGQKPKSDPKKDAVQIGQKVLATAVDLLGEKVVGKYKDQAFKHLSALAEQHLGKNGIGKDLADAAIKLLSDAADRLATPKPGLAKEDAIFGDTNFKELEGGLYSISGGNAFRPTHAIHDLLGIAGLDNKSGFTSTIKDLITGAAKLDLRVKGDWLKLGSNILMAAMATPGGWQAKLAAAGLVLGDGVVGAVEIGVKPKTPKAQGTNTNAPINGDAKAEAEAKKSVGTTEGHQLAPPPTNGEEKRYNPLAAMLGQMITTQREGGPRTLHSLRGSTTTAPSTKGEEAKAKADAIRRELVSAEAITSEVGRILGVKPGNKGLQKASQALMQALQSVDGKDGGPKGADQLSLMLAIYRTLESQGKDQGLSATQLKRLKAITGHVEMLQRMMVGKSQERVNLDIYSPHLTRLCNRMVTAAVVELVQQNTGIRPGEQLGLDESVIGNLQRALRTDEKFKPGQATPQASRLRELLNTNAQVAGHLLDKDRPPIRLSQDGPELKLDAENSLALASGLAQTLGLPEGSAQKIDAALQEVFAASKGEGKGSLLDALARWFEGKAASVPASVQGAGEIVATSGSALAQAQLAAKELAPILEKLQTAEQGIQRQIEVLEKKLTALKAGNKSTKKTEDELTGAQADLKALKEHQGTLQTRMDGIQAAVAKGQEGLNTGMVRLLQEFAQAASDPEAYKAKAEANKAKLDGLGELFQKVQGGGPEAAAVAKQILDDPELIKIIRSELGNGAEDALKFLGTVAAGGGNDDPPNKATSKAGGGGSGKGGGAKGAGSEKDLTIAQQRYYACREVLADSSLSIQDKMLYFLFIFALYTDREREASMEEFTKQDQAQAEWKATEKSLDQSIADRNKVVEGHEEELKTIKQEIEAQKRTGLEVSPELQAKHDLQVETLSAAKGNLEAVTKERESGAKDMGSNAKNQDIMFMNLERITQRYTQLLQLINSLLEKSDRLIEKLSR
jgi:hypothetical protein